MTKEELIAALQEIKQLKMQAMKQDKFEHAANLRDREKMLMAELEALEHAGEK